MQLYLDGRTHERRSSQYIINLGSFPKQQLAAFWATESLWLGVWTLEEWCYRWCGEWCAVFGGRRWFVGDSEFYDDDPVSLVYCSGCTPFAFQPPFDSFALCVGRRTRRVLTCIIFCRHHHPPIAFYLVCRLSLSHIHHPPDRLLIHVHSHYSPPVLPPKSLCSCLVLCDVS